MALKPRTKNRDLTPALPSLTRVKDPGELDEFPGVVGVVLNSEESFSEEAVRGLPREWLGEFALRNQRFHFLLDLDEAAKGPVPVIALPEGGGPIIVGPVELPVLATEVGAVGMKIYKRSAHVLQDLPRGALHSFQTDVAPVRWNLGQKVFDRIVSLPAAKRGD